MWQSVKYYVGIVAMSDINGLDIFVRYFLSCSEIHMHIYNAYVCVCGVSYLCIRCSSNLAVTAHYICSCISKADLLIC